MNILSHSRCRKQVILQRLSEEQTSIHHYLHLEYRTRFLQVNEINILAKLGG